MHLACVLWFFVRGASAKSRLGIQTEARGETDQSRCNCCCSPHTPTPREVARNSIPTAPTCCVVGARFLASRPPLFLPARPPPQPRARGSARRTPRRRQDAPPAA